MRTQGRGLGRRGASAAILVVSLAAMLGMIALAVDIGMLMKVRTDAQRAADAAALAGAQDFLDPSLPNPKNSALYHALEYASRNYVAWKYVDTSNVVVMDSLASVGRYVGNSPEAYVQVMPDTYKVRVFIRRASTATWFGHMLGIDFVPITVKAAAQAVNAGTGKCVKPFAIPDMWQDNNDDTNGNRIDDINGQQGKQGGEDWAFDPTDVYQRFQDPNYPNSPSTWTGWGSSWRNNNYATANPNVYYYNDYGRQMVIKMSNPQESPSPGFFYPWTMPYDSANPQAYCDANGCATPNNGAQWYKWNISNCNPIPVTTSETVNQDAGYLDKPGNMIGPTNQGMQALIDEDPLACWVEFPDVNPDHIGHSYTSGEVRRRSSATGPCDQPYAGWQDSPRVAMVPLFDPSQITSGRTTLTFNNLALIFIEGQDNAHSQVTARFMYYAKSTGPLAPMTGSLIKKLQLVE